MKILVNAASIKEGGPKIVLLRLLAAMQQHRPDIEWIVAANPVCMPDRSAVPGTAWIAVPQIDRSALHVPLWYEFGLPKLVEWHRPSAVFSLTNYLPRRRLRCPSLLLVQHAGHFSAEFDRLMHGADISIPARWAWRRKSNWVRRSIARADAVTVQTNALANQIGRQTGRGKSAIHIIPHGPGVAQSLETFKPKPQREVPRIGYITKWGVQKNFHTLFEAARTLKQSGQRFQLVLTLAKDYPPAKAVLDSARDIADVIDNRGELARPEDIVALYDSLDIFVFPSLCESFGFPMLEAMSRGLPIVVAATAENLEMMGGAGIGFAARDANELARLLAGLLSDEAARAAMGARSLQRSGDFSWQESARRTVAALQSVAR